MHPLTLFEAMLVTHFVMDWIFQTKWEAFGKSRSWIPLVVHCLIYTVGFIPIFFFWKVSFVWLIFIFLTHLVLDQRKVEFWIMDKIKAMKKEDTPETVFGFMLVGVDQSLHLVVLAIITLFS